MASLGLIKNGRLEQYYVDATRSERYFILESRKHAARPVQPDFKTYDSFADSFLNHKHTAQP